jgi:hypothetical protein
MPHTYCILQTPPSRPLASCEARNSDPTLAPRAWLSFAQHDQTQGLGLDKGLVLLKGVLKADRYEVRLHYLRWLDVWLSTVLHCEGRLRFQVMM